MTNLTNDLLEWAIYHRRYLHENPELSGREYNTCAYIKGVLKELGLELLPCIEPSIIGYVKGAVGEKTIALRADIDALPIQEEGEKQCLSKVPGISHTCGHDGHTAILLSVAKWVMENREKVKHNIVFIFQSCEEISPSGAEKLVKEGVLEQVDEIFGLHLMSDEPKGKIIMKTGEFMGSSDDFVITVQGKGGHAAFPQDTVDPTYVAAHIIIALQAIVGRRMNPVESSVISVGQVIAGSSTNIIPDKATITGTFRTFSHEVRERLMNEMKRLVEQMSLTFGAVGTVEFIIGTPPVVNDVDVTKKLSGLFKETYPNRVIEKDKPIMVAEDFAYYLEKIPGSYYHIGMKGEKSQYPHHHPKFDIDEEELGAAIDTFLTIVTSYH